MPSPLETGALVRAAVAALPCQYTGAQIQTAIDATVAAGGGTVLLQPGVYCVSTPVLVPSRISLVGAGTGATIVRGPVGSITGVNVNGADVYSTVAAVAAEAASITDLTVDNATNSTQSNGISLLPDGANYGGTPSSRCVVENVRVLGAGDYHTYMIWNLRGTHNKIVNNWIDGGVGAYAPASAQEGIESFGGTGILISGNTVQNIGDACVNLGAAALANTGTTGINAESNVLTNCGKGVNIGPYYDSAIGSQETAHIHVRGNIILNSWSVGIYATAVEGTVNRDLQVSENSIKNVGSSSQSGYGIFFNGNPTVATDSLTVVANTISSNTIENVMGPNGLGILLVQYPNVRVVENSLTSCNHSGIYLIGAPDADIRGNKIREPGVYGISLESSSDRGIVKDNFVWQWARRIDAAGIRAANSSGVLVQGNTFFIDNIARVEPAAARIEASVLQGVLSGNTLLYAPRTSAPFVNSSSNPNQGLCRPAAAGVQTIRVNNTLVTAGSRIMLTQVAGPGGGSNISAGAGFFTVSAAPSVFAGTEVFQYDILQ